jgi:phosphoribosylanthranilate isomerase
MIYVKICGITRYDDALTAAQAGADMLGLNFYRKSARFIEPDAAREIAVRLRRELGVAMPLLIGLFVNDGVGRISETMETVGLNYAQLSGDESGEMLRELRGTAYKAIRPRTVAEATTDADYYLGFASDNARLPSLLVDAHKTGMYGGTGVRAEFEIAQAAHGRVPRLMLAGGLTPDNVAESVQAVRPWAVDVASGVEVEGQPGIKDADKIRAFVQAARLAAEQGAG